MEQNIDSDAFRTRFKKSCLQYAPSLPLGCYNDPQIFEDTLDGYPGKIIIQFDSTDHIEFVCKSCDALLELIVEQIKKD